MKSLCVFTVIVVVWFLWIITYLAYITRDYQSIKTILKSQNSLILLEKYRAPEFQAFATDKLNNTFKETPTENLYKCLALEQLYNYYILVKDRTDKHERYNQLAKAIEQHNNFEEKYYTTRTLINQLEHSDKSNEIETLNTKLSEYCLQQSLPIDNDYKRVQKVQKEYKQKHRLAIIIVIDIRSTIRYTGDIITTSCYSALHGIPIYYEHLDIQTDFDVYRRRIRHYLKYLEHYQWIVCVDGDNRVTNYSSSIYPFLDDSYDIIFHERDNGEIAAAAIAVRSTEFSRSFLIDWLSLGEETYNKLNSDNGDLLQCFLRRFYPEEEKRIDRGELNKDNSGCSRNQEPCELHKYRRFIDTFNNLLHSKPLSTYYPIKIYNTYNGFWRTLEGPKGSLSGTLVHSPHIFGHGKGWQHEINNIHNQELYCDPILLEVSTVHPEMYFETKAEAQRLATEQRYLDHYVCWEKSKNVCNPDYSPLV